VRRDTLVADGLRSPAILGGPEDEREAVVFVHGNPGSCEDWADLARRTEPFARVLAVTMPGFGQADKPAGFDYTVDGYARHLDALLAVAGVERAHLVLHDFGGPWGLAWGVAHPERLASLTLVNTGAFLRYRWHRLARIWQTPVLGELFQATTTRRGFEFVLKHDNPKLPQRHVDEMWANTDAGTKRAILRLYRATRDPSGMAALMAPVWRRLDPPCCVVWGETDAYIPVEQAERQREVFPSAEVHVLPGLGHWCYFEDPDAVAGLVVPFLQRVCTSSSAGASVSGGIG
jgi:pimeloyl-ACP methyl ester carboxylesterase